MELLNKFEAFLKQVKVIAPEIETGEITEDGYLFPFAVMVGDNMIECDPSGSFRVQLYAGNNTYMKSKTDLTPAEVATILNAFE